MVKRLGSQLLMHQGRVKQHHLGDITDNNLRVNLAVEMAILGLKVVFLKKNTESNSNSDIFAHNFILWLLVAATTVKK